MPVSTSFARGFLRKAWADAQAASPTVTLLAKLNELSSAAVSAVSSRKTLSGTTGHGRSVTFQVHSAEGITPTDVAELTSRLLDLYDTVTADGAATDSARFSAMLVALVPARVFSTDFSQFQRY